MRVNVILLIFAYFLSFYEIFGVNRAKFKDCNQSGFCKRVFGTKIVQNRYKVDEKTINCENGVIRAEILDQIFNSTMLISISSLMHNSVHLKVVEKDPAFPRYDVFKDGWKGLQDEPIVDSSTQTFRSKNECSMRFSSGNVLLIKFDSFLISISNSKGEKLVSINEQNSIFIEPHLHHKKTSINVPVKTQDDSPNESIDSNEEEEPVEVQTNLDESFDGHTDNQPHGHQAVSFDLTFNNFENVYGIPEHADTFSLNTDGKDPYRLFNLDVFEYELYNKMALYGSVPFLMASNVNNSIGFLFLNPSETWVLLSKKKSNPLYSFIGYISKDSEPHISARWVSESGIIDTFIMMGPSPNHVSFQNSIITGFQQFPPLFSIAYHQCRWNYLDAEDVLNVNSKFDAYNIPYDVIWLDIDHTPNRKYFLFDTQKFPDTLSMIRKISFNGRKLVTIVDPHVSKSYDYSVYNEALASDFLVKNHHNSTYEGWCWPGNSVYPDFSQEKVREWWAGQFALDKYKGTTTDVFTWIDMDEPSVFNGPEVTLPKNVLHGSWESRDIHNLYGYFYHVAAYDGGLVRSNNSIRPFVLTRAFFAGSQKYGAAWTGDNTASWDHLKITVPMLLSLSISGIHFCGADAGGFFGNPDDELHVRWIQAASMQPFFRAHSHTDSKRREFWLYSEETRNLLREQVIRRYQYLPYIYTLFYLSSTHGIPIMKPLWYDFSSDPQTFSIEDSYLLGSSLLIKPIVSPQTSKISVYFPSSPAPLVWYDITHDSFIRAGQTVTISFQKLTDLPMFQIGGSIIPTWNRLRRSSAKMINDPLTLNVVLDLKGNAKGHFYIDDGLSFEYLSYNYLLCNFTLHDKVLHSKPMGKFVTPIWVERIIISSSEKLDIVSANVISINDVKTNMPLVVNALSSQRIIIRRPGVRLMSSFQIEFE